MKILLSVILTLLAVSPAWAEAPIYVVDLQQVIDQSLLGKATRQKLEDQIKKSQLELEKVKLSIKNLSDEIAKQSSLLSPAALEAKRDALNVKQREFSRLARDEQAELKRSNERSLGALVEQAEKVVAELAKKEGFDFVVQKRPGTVVYVDPAYDITLKVIKAFDSSAKS